MASLPPSSSPRRRRRGLELILSLLLVPLLVSQARAQNPPADALCRLCHGEIHTTAESPGPRPHEPHEEVTCVDCHAALKAFDPSEDEHEHPVSKATCLPCHENQRSQLEASIHASPRSDCTSCHAPHAIGLAVPDGAACKTCHADAARAWVRSVHAGDPGTGRPAAGCVDCHGSHDVLPAKDPSSRVYPLHVPDLCESCHKPDPSPEHPAPGGKRVREYETSVHGMGLRVSGLIVTATCVSCHGAHEVRSPDDPEASTARRRIPTTCGACHAGILATYVSSVHGADFLKGNADVPVCTDCHREHAIRSPGSEGSSVSPSLVAKTCARCHADETLANLYGFSPTSLRSWGRSYHGIASDLGALTAANCASCHGFHDILPSSDPRSPVNPANLDRTCGSCHVGAGAAFSRVPVHSVIERDTNPAAYFLVRTYTVLIGLVIGAFVLFILIDIFGLLRIHIGIGPPETEHVDPRQWPDEDRLVPPTESFERMGRQPRIQHALLVTSFLLLLLTGLPLFLHDTPWMRSIVDFEGGFRLRSQLHRAGAIGLIGVSVWHVTMMAVSAPARRWLAMIVPRPSDVTQFVRDALFSLGLRRERPPLDRYGLVEKLEYGAVVWGNLIMIGSGTILWRPDWFLSWMPSWTFDVCRVVHGYEATLAFLAIIVWHMYHVHLRPGAFPMNRAWLTGRISREELRRHHALEYLRILKRRRKSSLPSDGEAKE